MMGNAFARQGSSQLLGNPRGGPADLASEKKGVDGEVAEGAVVVDTSDLGLEEVVDRLVELFAAARSGASDD